MEYQEKNSESSNLKTTYVVEEQKIISLNKFVFLSIISFGVYQIWWIYKAWRFYQQKDNLDINPALRTIFSIIFLIPLFNKILLSAKKTGYNESYSAILLFVGFWVLNILSQLPDPFWLISILGFVFLIAPFKAFDFARQNSTDFIVTKQTSYSGRQIALIVFGVIFWCLVLFGLTVPD